MEQIIKYAPYIYLLVISLISFIVTCYDKIAAKKLPEHRIPEATLFMLSALGGSIVMLPTMLLIRHKTKHKRFMIGIPVIIAFQTGLFIAVWYFLCR